MKDAEMLYKIIQSVAVLLASVVSEYSNQSSLLFCSTRIGQIMIWLVQKEVMHFRKLFIIRLHVLSPQLSIKLTYVTQFCLRRYWMEKPFTPFSLQPSSGAQGVLPALRGPRGCVVAASPSLCPLQEGLWETREI